MAKNDLRSRLGYLNAEDIQTRIDDGLLDEYDVVLVKDQDTAAFIAPDKTIHHIGARLNAYMSERTAIRALNASPTTYVGMPVAIYYNGSYKLFLVDGTVGDWTVLPAWGNPSNFSYNDLVDVPLINKIGTSEDVVILNELADGMYAVNGKFKVTADSSTTFSLSSPELVIVQNNGTEIKRINATEITSYDTSSGEPVEDPMTTETKVDEMIDVQFNERLEETSSESIQDLFN